MSQPQKDVIKRGFSPQILGAGRAEGEEEGFKKFREAL